MGTVDAVVTLKAEAGVLTGQFDLGNGRTWPIEEGTIEGAPSTLRSTAMGLR